MQVEKTETVEISPLRLMSKQFRRTVRNKIADFYKSFTDMSYNSTSANRFPMVRVSK